MIQNGSFESQSCDICGSVDEFYNGCLPNWEVYDGSPSAFDSSLPNCTFLSSNSYYYAPDGDFHAMAHANSGIFQVGDYEAGNYQVSMQYTRGEGIYDLYPVYINVAFGNGMQNVPYNDDSNLALEIYNVFSKEVLWNHTTIWADLFKQFTLPEDFEDIIIYATTSEVPFGYNTPPTTLAPTMRVLFDAVELIPLEGPVGCFTPANTYTDMVTGEIDNWSNPFGSGMISGSLDEGAACYFPTCNEDEYTDDEVVTFFVVGLDGNDVEIGECDIFCGPETGPYSLEDQEEIFDTVLALAYTNAPECPSSGMKKVPVGFDFFKIDLGNDTLAMGVHIRFACCDLCDPEATGGFELEAECDEGTWKVHYKADELFGFNHTWELWTADNNGNPIELKSTHSPDGIGSFNWLDQSKRYVIKHILSGPCLEEDITITLPVPQFNTYVEFHFEDEDGNIKDEFCYGEDIFLNGIASEGETRYYISVARRDINSGGGYMDYTSLGWTIDQEVDIVNLSEEFGDIGFNFDPDYEYKVKLATSDPSECEKWTEVTQTFTVICCDNQFDPRFLLDDLGDDNGRTLKAHSFETYGDDVTHEWYVLCSDEKDGPYTPIGMWTGPSFSWSGAEYGKYYHVIHKIITPCGEFCYGRVAFQEPGAQVREIASEDLTGSIGCDILDEWWPPCDAPTDVKYSCRGNVISWSGSADSFTIEINWNDPACCKKTGEWVAQRFEVEGGKDGGSFTLPFSPKYTCGSIRIAAHCGETTTWSESVCFSCRRRGEEPPYDGEVKPRDIVASPNPAFDMIRIEVKTEVDEIGTIAIYSKEGELMDRIKASSNQSIEVDVSRYPADMYLFNFESRNGISEMQKFVVLH